MASTAKAKDMSKELSKLKKDASHVISDIKEISEVMNQKVAETAYDTRAELEARVAEQITELRGKLEIIEGKMAVYGKKLDTNIAENKYAYLAGAFVAGIAAAKLLFNRN